MCKNASGRRAANLADELGQKCEKIVRCDSETSEALATALKIDETEPGRRKLDE
jgi:hypothetical protein